LLPLLILLSCSGIRAESRQNAAGSTDSLFLHVSGAGDMFIQHRMEAGQTIYALARFFGLKPAQVYSWNPELDTAGAFRIGQEVRIPLSDAALVRPPLDSAVRDGFLPVYYVVRPGDTFYAIANRFFRIPLSELLNINHLETYQLQRGQHLQVGWIPAEGIPDSLQTSDPVGWNDRLTALRNTFIEQQARMPLVRQQGAAYWQRERKGSNDYYALHRDAPKDAVLEIFNPMKNKMVYARVLGGIPQQAYGDDVIVVLSPSLARLLEARDARFFVEIRYCKR
jgi:LysM repeat protein